MITAIIVKTENIMTIIIERKSWIVSRDINQAWETVFAYLLSSNESCNFYK